MKVIRKGSDWTKETVCGTRLMIGGCGSLLLVAEEDLYQHYFGDEDGYGRAFKCPVCGEENYFTYQDLLKEVFSRTDRAKPSKERKSEKPKASP